MCKLAYRMLAVFIILCVSVLASCAAPTLTPEPTPTPLPPTPTPSDVIIVHYHERPPYMSSTTTGVQGITADPAAQAFKQAGIRFEWQQTPAKRQTQIIQENTGLDCGLGWFKNPEREKYARFSLPLYQDKPMIALARADNTALKSGGTVEETLKNPDVVLLVKEGYSYGVFLDEKIAALKPRQTSTTAENVNMLQMIYNQRADYFFIAPEEADLLFEAAGLAASDFKRVEFSDMPIGSKRHLMCSMKVDPAIIERLNVALQQIVGIPAD